MEELVLSAAVAGARLTEMGINVKFTPLLARPPTVTTTLPLIAPAGTGTRIEFTLQNVGVARVPPNETVLEPSVDPKPPPLICTEAPAPPDVGFRLVIIGAGVTAKFTPLLAMPATITTTFPVEAPTGTNTEMLVGVQRLGDAATPLNVTVPKVGPKFNPVIVTCSPTGPDVGLKLVMVGVGRTVNPTPLLATPLTVTTTFPVVVPDGTVATMFVALQLPAIPAETPPNVTVLDPCEGPKFDPAIVTCVPTGPETGFRLEILGGKTPLAVLNAAKPAPQLSDAASVAVAEMGPATAWMPSSTINLVLGAAGTLSSLANPLPGAYVAPFAVTSAVNTKSPPIVVAAVPLFKAVPVPWAATAASREFDAAKPEYSRIAKRIVLLETDSDTVTVFAPPAIFSA